ncbi:MAG: Pr6Pr family membrane protein [Microbacterium chocolatum]|nr:Pr6Pr family membrane protein [Microbacterium chocolatum]
MAHRTHSRPTAITLRPVALAYRLVALGLIATGVIRLLDLFTADPSWKTLLYFTALSNVAATVWMLFLVVATVRDLTRHGARGTTEPLPRIQGAVMMALVVTMLVYTVVLVPSLTQDPAYEAYTLTDSLVHVISPLLVVGEWLLLRTKGRMRWLDPLAWTLFPLAYLAFAFIYGALGGEFEPGVNHPYPFMDVGALGVGGVALWILALVVVLEAFGFLLVAIDRGLGTLAAKRAQEVAPVRARV